MDVLQLLRDAGVSVDQLPAPSMPPDIAQPDAIIEVRFGDATARFAVEEKRRAPYPNELARLSRQRQALTQVGQPMLVAPFVTEALGASLITAGWSWADTEGNFHLCAPSLLLRQRRTMTPPKPKRRGLPQGSGSLAIIRALIRFRADEQEEMSTTALAAQAGVSQPRASQVLGQLRDLKLVDTSQRRRWQPDREALLDRFLAEYAGPHGSERYLYSLDSLTDVAVLAAGSRAPQQRIAVSADVGPDLVLAWRRPSIVIMYTAHEITASELRLVDARSPADANVIVRIPDDRSVFPVPKLAAEVGDREVCLADPSQMIWDLHQLGGEDRLEAAGMLRQWLLKRP